MRPGRISWALIAPLVAAGLLGCAAPGATGTPPVGAVRPIASPSPAGGRYPDGLPRLFADQPVLRGVAALDHERAATDASPFLLGGWVTFIPGIFYSCPAETAPADLWLAPCGQPAFSDVAGVTNGDLVAQGELTFHFADVSHLESGPAILRVHVHDPRAGQCGLEAATCARAMVVEAVLWTGDEATAPRPLSVAAVSVVLHGVAPDATLVPEGNGVYGADCGSLIAAAREYVVPAPSPYIPTFSLVAIAPSPAALARALPIPSGAAGALEDGLIGIVSSGGGPPVGGFECRWLRVANVAVLVRTSDPPRRTDRAFLERLVGALDAASGSLPPT
jgi:hypothetical protein